MGLRFQGLRFRRVPTTKSNPQDVANFGFRYPKKMNRSCWKLPLVLVSSEICGLLATTITNVIASIATSIPVANSLTVFTMKATVTTLSSATRLKELKPSTHSEAAATLLQGCGL